MSTRPQASTRRDVYLCICAYVVYAYGDMYTHVVFQCACPQYTTHTLYSGAHVSLYVHMYAHVVFQAPDTTFVHTRCIRGLKYAYVHMHVHIRCIYVWRHVHTQFVLTHTLYSYTHVVFTRTLYSRPRACGRPVTLRPCISLTTRSSFQ